MARAFAKSPREYYLRFVLEKLPPEPPSDPMRLGSLRHLALWEPDRLHEVAALPPAAWDLRSPAGRAARDAWLASLEPSRIATTDVELGKALGMAAAARAEPFVQQLMQRDHACEHAAHWECAWTGLPRKVMFDLITLDHGPPIIADLKSSEAYPNMFRAAAIRYGYALQAAWYLEAARELGIDDARFICIVCRSVYPWDILLWEFSEDTLARADVRLYEIMNGIADATQTGVWEHPYANIVQTLDLPPWALH